MVVSCRALCCRFFFFFFQAEDGIRDGHVTGVQTCALPISTVGIPFYFADGIERIVNLEGLTHHKDGTKTPLQTSFARTSELNSRYRILEFEMPAAGAGDEIGRAHV